MRAAEIHFGDFASVIGRYRAVRALLEDCYALEGKRTRNVFRGEVSSDTLHGLAVSDHDWPLHLYQPTRVTPQIQIGDGGCRACGGAGRVFALEPDLIEGQRRTVKTCECVQPIPVRMVTR